MQIYFVLRSVFAIFATAFCKECKTFCSILLSNHHLTKRIKEQTNLRWSYALSVDFSHSRLGACGEPDRRYGGSALSLCL